MSDDEEEPVRLRKAVFHRSRFLALCLDGFETCPDLVGAYGGRTETPHEAARLLARERTSVCNLDNTETCRFTFAPSVLVIPESEAADQKARDYKEVWLSPCLDIPVGAVSLEDVDVAAYVDGFSEQTQVRITEDQRDEFNSVWRDMLRNMFSELPEGSLELEEWLGTGLSNGLPLRVQLMCLPPNTWFRVHAHPCIELMLSLAGTLKEVRLANLVVPATQFVMKDQGTLLGPNLAALRAAHEAEGSPLEWQLQQVEKGQFLANVIGSVHQSFTGEEGATLLLLWGGAHANCTPASCVGVCELLHPDVGH